MDKQKNQNRHDFLHTFFKNPEVYDEIEINGFYLVNQYNSNLKRWEVAIFTKESFINRKMFLNQKPQDDAIQGSLIT